MLIMDHIESVFDQNRFQDCDWEEFYLDSQEVVPPDAPKPLGKPVTMTEHVWVLTMQGAMRPGGCIVGSLSLSTGLLYYGFPSGRPQWRPPHLVVR